MNLVTELYPLGHSDLEMNRLNTQALLFRDEWLLKLAQASSTCLEIGAGIGSNLPSLLEVNSALEYHGIDISPSAVESAQECHGSGNAIFSVGNGTNLNFADSSFQLVFSKLVLWSMGQSWKKAVSEAYRVTAQGGTFYAFEPYDAGVLFEPAKPAFQEALQHWGKVASQKGIDLCIGPKVAGEMEKAGFKNVQTKFFPVLAQASEAIRYKAICENLADFYFGVSTSEYLQGLSMEKVIHAQEELKALSKGLVMDAFFISWGEK